MQVKTTVYNRIVDLALKTKEDFKARGIAIPTTNESGEIKIGRFFIVRENGSYSVLNLRREKIYDNLNLPQTAILVANSLALNQSVNQTLLIHDYRYGCSEFDEENYRRIAKSLMHKQDWERYESVLIKQEIAQEKSEMSKNEILRSFQKLSHLR